MLKKLTTIIVTGFAAATAVLLTACILLLYPIHSTILAFSFIAAAFVLFASYSAIHNILFPLRRIGTALQELAEGQLSTRISLTSQHCLYDISKSFNRMAETLESRVSERNAAVASLIRLNERLVAAHQENVNKYLELEKESHRRKQAQYALSLSEEKFSKAFHCSADTIMILRIADTSCQEVSDSFLHSFNYHRHEIIGHSSESLKLWPSDYEHEEFWSQVVETRSLRNWETRWKTRQGDIRTGLLSGDVIHIHQQPCFLFAWHDITEQKSAELALKKSHAEIRRIAYFDPLTGLPNRAYLQKHLEEELTKCRFSDHEGTIFFIDLDDMKTINTAFGHACGDGLIISAAAYIVAEAGCHAFVAHISGDSFMVVLSGETSRRPVLERANRILQSLNREYDVWGARFQISASMGILTYPDDADTIDRILVCADNALYAAKAAGKNICCFYNDTMEKNACEDTLLSNSLRHAAERGELYLHYQPQVHLATGQVLGFEALLRWNSPDHGPIPPSRFIPLAEQNGHIHMLGQWVIREACRFARRLTDSGFPQIRVGVNVSPHQLANDDFIRFLQDTLGAANISPSQIELEITESSLMLSLSDGSHKLTELRAMGFLLSLDDFGTGYSSLTYLRHLPVHNLKIDKSFINMIPADTTQSQILESVVHMARALQMTVVAEGVETAAQMEHLTRIRCDAVQGYYLSRPIPEEEALQFLDRPNPSKSKVIQHILLA